VLGRVALGSFFDVQCRGLPLLSLRSSKRARSDPPEGAVVSTMNASEVTSVVMAAFHFGLQKQLQYEFHLTVLIIVWQFQPTPEVIHKKFFIGPADRAFNTSFHQLIYYGEFQVIQIMAAARLTLTGRVIGSALAIWASLCFCARVSSSCTRVAS